MRLSYLACCAVAALTIAAPAAAQTFVVDAQANSSSGGTGLASIVLIAGQTFTVSSSTDDLWSAGALPRFSDANGLTADRWATATDDSGEAVGTLNLYYWDSNNGDNFGSISFDIQAVPEPAAWGMMIGGFGLAGMALRRRKPVAALA